MTNNSVIQLCFARFTVAQIYDSTPTRMFENDVAIILGELVKKQCRMAKIIKKQGRCRGRKKEEKIKREKKKKNKVFAKVSVEYIRKCKKNLG